MPNRHLQRLPSILFLTLIFILIPIFGSKAFLNPYHYIAQFGVLSCILFLIINFYFFCGKKNIHSFQSIFQTGFEALLVLYLCWTSLSFFWSTNSSEALFFIHKMWLLGISYFLLKFIFETYLKQNSKIIYQLSCLATYILILHTIYAFFDLHHRLENKSLLFLFQNSVLYALRCVSGHKAILATLLLLLLPFNIIGLGEKKQSKSYQIIYILAIVCQIGMIFLLQSRGVIIGLLVVMIGLFWGKNKNRFKLKKYSLTYSISILLLTFLLAGLVFFGADKSPFLSRLNPFNWMASNGVDERFQLLTKTWQLIQQSIWNFFFGLGAGNWEINFPSVGLSDLRRVTYYEKVIKHPHSYLLGTWSELGLIGFILYLNFF